MNVLRIAFFAVCVAIVATSAAAQDVPTGTLTGHVTDVNGNPLAGAFVNALDVGVATNAVDDGAYALSLPAGDHVIVASTSALSSDQIFVSVPENDTAFVEVVAGNVI